MYNKNAHQQYTNVQVSTVDRGRLLLMLYDGCIKFLRHAKSGLESKDLPKFAKYLSKSQAIISELMLTLDHEKGGRIAEELERLYDFMLYYLTEANLHKDPEKIDRVISLMETITAAYREIIEVRKIIQTLPEEEQGTQAVAPTSSAKTSSSTKQEKTEENPGQSISVAL